MLNKKVNWLLLLGSLLLFLTGCGSEQSAPEGDLIAINEQGEEVTLTNKDRATILFHFTEVG